MESALIAMRLIVGEYKIRPYSIVFNVIDANQRITKVFSSPFSARFHSAGSSALIVSSESASVIGLSVRQRNIRGKRTAMPDLWRDER